jgi:hypothetical protein
MADRQPDRPEGLSDAELSAEQGTELPDREAMSTMRFMPLDVFDMANIDNLSMPVNQAISINIDTTQSISSAEASQVVIGDQADTLPPNGGTA